jgi:hypothetical protein
LIGIPSAQGGDGSAGVERGVPLWANKAEGI